MASSERGPESRLITGGALRRYPPLVFLVVVLLIAALVLPSALNLPQANPTTVLEYAPVPPEDESPPSAEGNVSALGLGSSSGLTTGAPPSVPQVDPQKKGGSGKRPVTKRCVGKPLRQTEDLNSPPCVPFFEGDNGGTTWQGVSADEVKILIYHAAFTSDNNETEGNDTSAGETTPSNRYCDLDKPDNQQPGPIAQWDCTDLDGGDLQVVGAARALARYFNDRFQTYDRRIHFYIFWASSSGGAAGRRADAAANWEFLKPFAVIDRATFGGFNDVYADALARRRISSYGSFGYLPAKDAQTRAPYIWNFWPDVEHWAELYISYVCKKVAPFSTSHAGDDKQNQKMNGKARKYAIMSTDDPSYPGLHYFRELVRVGIERCGIVNPIDVRFPFAGANIDNRARADSDYGIANVAKMQGDNVTTVLWLGGMESKTTLAAEHASYFPEWVVAGDRIIDDLLNGRAQAQRVWAHAWVVSSQLREIRFEESPARQAFREADPDARPVREYWATTLYKDMFAVAKAIQVAGPHLSPQTVDQGLHAIPRASSNDPRIAACFYDPGDYSCVKDAHEAWWDSSAPDPNREAGAIGCWRMVSAGKRYLAGGWEGGDIVFNPSDVCNGIKGASHNYPA